MQTYVRTVEEIRTSVQVEETYTYIHTYIQYVGGSSEAGL